MVVDSENGWKHLVGGQANILKNSLSHTYTLPSASIVKIPVAAFLALMVRVSTYSSMRIVRMNQMKSAK